MPTNQPTAFPTTPLQTLISFNVTQHLHEVNYVKFNAQRIQCVQALKNTVAKLLDTFTEEGFKFRGRAVYYENEIYDQDTTSTVAGPDHIQRPNEHGRALGMTHGSRGAQVTYTVFVVPTAIGFSDSDAAYKYTKNVLLKSEDRGIFAGLLRDQADFWSCEALQVTEGTTITFVSSDYQSVVTHSAYPTSFPTLLPRVERPRNFVGVITGVLLGVSAFIALSMYLAFYKDHVAATFGLSIMLKNEDFEKDEPKKVEGGDDVNI